MTYYITFAHLPLRFEVNHMSTGWCNTGCSAIVDTGTSLLEAPPQYVDGLHNMLGAYKDDSGEVRYPPPPPLTHCNMQYTFKYYITTLILNTV